VNQLALREAIMAEQTLKPCRFCSSSALDVKQANSNCYVVCRDSGVEGPEAEAPELACSRWILVQLIGGGISFDSSFHLYQWRVQSGNGSPLLKPGF
jgi:hypothetical protein